MLHPGYSLHSLIFFVVFLIIFSAAVGSSINCSLHLSSDVTRRPIFRYGVQGDNIGVILSRQRFLMSYYILVPEIMLHAVRDHNIVGIPVGRRYHLPHMIN